MTPEQLKKIIIVIGTASVIGAFIWAQRMSGGNSREAFVFSVKVSMFFWAVLFCVKRSQAKKESGLSGDQYLLDKVGGPEKLAKQAKINCIIGWLFLAVSVITCLFVVKFPVMVILGCIVGIPSLLCGLYLLWLSKKCSRIVSEANGCSSFRSN